MAEEDLGSAYSGQQEDINDKLLLDLAWERQQKKVGWEGRREGLCVQSMFIANCFWGAASCEEAGGWAGKRL